VGGTGGIGRAIAAALRDEGVDVVIARHQPAAQSDMHNGPRGGFLGEVSLDLTERASIDRAIQDTTHLAPDIDILICSAARPSFGSVWDFEPCDWELTAQVKFLGTAYLCREIARGMVARGSGVIVVLSGIAAVATMGTSLVGGAGNAALESFARGLAAETGPAGVRVISVSPGMTDTPRFGAFSDPAVHRALVSSIPLRRVATPREIADVVIFAVSDRAGYVTGTTIVVDGGLLSGRRDPHYIAETIRREARDAGTQM